LTRLDQLRNWREAPDLFLQITGEPAGPSPLIGSCGSSKEDAMPADQSADLGQVGEATVPCGPEAPFLARRTVSCWLEGRGQAQLQEDAVLLVSELVTNSVQHAGQPPGAPVQIRAAAVDGVVRVEVHDRGHGPVRRRAPGPRPGGFGLSLVNELAARWGVSHDQGTRVWFELAAPSPAV
jgi:serine/threonine-protein kinase RsbW